MYHLYNLCGIYMIRLFWVRSSNILYNYFNELSMKRSWGFLIAKQYNYQFENFYATVIQQAYRNYKKRPESLAKRIWEAVRNNGTPNRKKFLGILKKGQMIINSETQEEYVIICEEFYAY